MHAHSQNLKFSPPKEDKKTPSHLVIQLECQCDDGEVFYAHVALLPHSSRARMDSNIRVVQNAISVEFLFAQMNFPIDNKKKFILNEKVIKDEEVIHRVKMLVYPDQFGNRTLAESVTCFLKKSGQEGLTPKDLIKFDVKDDTKYIEYENTLTKEVNAGIIYQRALFTPLEEDNLPEGWGVSPKGYKPVKSRKVYYDPGTGTNYMSISEVEKAVAAKAKAAAAKATAWGWV